MRREKIKPATLEEYRFREKWDYTQWGYSRSVHA